jgi:hypothetical protein
MPFTVGPSRKPQFWEDVARHEKAARKKPEPVEPEVHRKPAKAVAVKPDVHKKAGKVHTPAKKGGKK